MYDKNKAPKSSKQQDSKARLAALEAENDQLSKEISTLERPNTRLSDLELELAQLTKEIDADEAALGSQPQRAQPTSDGLPPVKDVDRPWGEALIRQGARGVTGLDVGLHSVADFPNIVAMGLHAAGLKEKPEFYPSRAEKRREYIKHATHGKLRPENKAEEYADTMTEALGPFLMAPFTGGSSVTGTIARAFTKKGAEKGVAAKLAKWGANTYKPTAGNIGGALGASAATKAYVDNKIENNEDPNFLPMIAASLVGGTLGRTAANYKRVAAKTAGVTTSFSPEEFAKQQKMGYPSSLSSTSKSMTPARVENFLSNLPFHEGSFNKFYKTQKEALAKNIGFQNPEDLKHIALNPKENLAKEGAAGYHKRVSKAYEKRGENFKGREEVAVRKKELVDVSDIIHNFEKERNLSPSLVSQKDFDKTPNGILLNKLKSYGEDNKKVSYHDLNKLRQKALNESIKLKTPLGGGTPESMEAAKRSSMLANKRHEFIEQTGTKLEAHNSREAKKFYAQFKDPETGTSHLIKAITKAPDDTTAFKKLKTDVGALNVVRQGLPKEDYPHLVESFMANLGKQGDTISINATHRGYTGLKPAIRKDLLRTITDKDQRKNFERTMDFIGDNKRMLNKIINTSHTTDKAEFIHQIKKYTKLGAGLAAGSGAAYLSLIPTLAGLATTKTVSKLWTNQKFLKHVNDTMKISTPEMIDNSLKAVQQSLTLANKEAAMRRKAEHK